MRRELVKTSKFLSLILRHDPGRVGLALDSEGWVSIDELIAASNRSGHPISREALLEVVATNEKQRFTLSEDHRRIRARQGHSISVELGLKPVTPPERLFHGTASRNLASIRAEGLLKSRRQHVHLSPDEATARRVGARHGTPIVLVVEARRFADFGARFFLSENGVWLTEHVAPAFIRFPEEPDA